MTGQAAQIRKPDTAGLTLSTLQPGPIFTIIASTGISVNMADKRTRNEVSLYMLYKRGCSDYSNIRHLITQCQIQATSTVVVHQGFFFQ